MDKSYCDINGNCGDGRNCDKFKVVYMGFLRSELLDSIDTPAWVEGDVLAQDDRDPDGHARHQIQDIVQDGNLNRVTRILDQSFAECVEMLLPYTRQDLVEGTREDDTLKYTDRYNMRLKVPEDFSKTTYNCLKQYIHNYMVSCVLEDWLSITSPDRSSSANWANKIAEVKEKIEGVKNWRIGRLKRRLCP